MTMAAMKKMIPRTVISAVYFCIFFSLKPYKLIVDLTFSRSWIKGCTVKDQELEIIIAMVRDLYSSLKNKDNRSFPEGFYYYQDEVVPGDPGRDRRSLKKVGF